jgi:hypothetical protein
VEVAGVEPASERAGVSPLRPAPAKRCPLDGYPPVEPCHPHPPSNYSAGVIRGQKGAGDRPLPPYGLHTGNVNSVVDSFELLGEFCYLSSKVRMTLLNGFHHFAILVSLRNP